MEKFLNLPLEKQDMIIDAALKVFGENGYKKASANDVAIAAGISKAMIFHYFGTKKGLYMYLVNLCGDIIIKEVNDKFDISVTDFFDRIKLATNIEIEILKKHPAFMAFLTSMYFEEADEVSEDIREALAKGEGFRSKIAFEGVDCSKFKDSVDIKLVMKMLTWIADGYAKELSKEVEIDYDKLFAEFSQCLDLLKSNLYKEEYV